MNTTPPDPTEDDPDALAGEYVLGLLDQAAAARASALRERDPRFAAAILAWEARLMPLADALAPAAPGPAVWQRIEAALSPAPARPRLWHSLRFWRAFGLAAGAFGVAGVTAALLLARLPRPASITPLAVATLRAPHDGIFVATLDMVAGRTCLVISPSRISMPADKSAELWLLLPGGPPQPVGLLASGHPVILSLRPMPAAQLRTAALAVSIEPPGGSASGLPTGPIMASAKFSAL